MKKEYIKISLAALFIILGIFLYQGDSDTKNSSTNPVFETTENTTEYYQITYKRPDGDFVGSDIVSSFVDKEVGKFESMAETNVPGLREMGFQHKYTLDINFDTYNSEKYLSYVAMIAEYAGGANVNQRVESFVFDKESQEQVLIPDILSLEGQNQLVLSVKEKLRSQEKSFDVFPGVSEKITLEDFDSFYITDQSITILFSKYEVAPGAAGVVSVSVDR